MTLNTAVPALRNGRPLLASRSGLPALAALAGIAAVIVGLILPWLTVFGGTASLDGIAAGGGTLAGIGTGAG
ncbi:hypothetical protein, partial [Sinomonas sp. G460-2]|uniref:hypothetical protein n=1 Tax=Sinomonas sp. G460-2 TaxID=3393464 RepID=UPI0039F01BFB